MVDSPPTNLVEYIRWLQATDPELPMVICANGASMAPSIVKGDRLHVRRPSGPLHVGDVVLARTASGRHVIHRIIALEPEIVTCGDAVEEPDERIDELLMRVERIETTWRSRLRRLTLKIERWLP